MQMLKEVDPIFKILYRVRGSISKRGLISEKITRHFFQNIYFTGSYYDGLRVKDALEFDLNVCLEIPDARDKIEFLSPLEVEAGFVKIKLDSELPRKLREDPLLGEKFMRHFVKTVDGVHYIHRSQVMSWFQGILQRALVKIDSGTLRACRIENVSASETSRAWTLF